MRGRFHYNDPFFHSDFGNAMRMRLVYLTCTVLWLVMSALIGMSFVSRSVFKAEQDFDAFNQRLVEHVGLTLHADAVVLNGYAAYRAFAGAHADDAGFAARLKADNPQIRRLLTFDGRSRAEAAARLPAPLRAGSGLASAAVTLAPGEPGLLLVRPVDASRRQFVALETPAAALLPALGRLPDGGRLQLWHGARSAGPALLDRATRARSGVEQLLFPRFSAVRRIGGSAQPMVIALSWQLGFSELNPVECVVAAALSLALLAIMLIGVSSYARFLAGSQAREMRLFYLANHDRLTNLANRNLFYDRLQHAISRLNRSGLSVAVLFLDMDRFKPVNDTYGHSTGDRVLQQIAARLKAELRGEDTVARLGGDEFSVLLEDVASKEEVNQVVERLKRAVERPYELDGHSIRLGVSIGVAYYPEDGVLIEELLSVADRKMYGEKNDPSVAVCCE